MPLEFLELYYPVISDAILSELHFTVVAVI